MAICVDQENDTKHVKNFVEEKDWILVDFDARVKFAHDLTGNAQSQLPLTILVVITTSTNTQLAIHIHGLLYVTPNVFVLIS